MSSNSNYPIVVFTYKRLRNFRVSINAIKNYKRISEKKIIFYSDGPKSEEDLRQILKVRKFIKSIKGFKDIEYRFSDSNKGLACSFIEGINEVLKCYESALFLEDDNLISPFLFDFIDDYKEQVLNHPNVSCISGYSPKLFINKKRPFFFPGAESWSFFTWREAWNCFEISNEKLINKLNNFYWKNLINDFLPYKKVVQDSKKNLNDSWSGRWGLSAFLDDRFILYPPKPLCINIGYEGSGTNSTSFSNIYNRKLSLDYIKNDLPNIPRNSYKVLPTIFSSKFAEIFDPYYLKYYGLKLIKNLSL